MVSDAFEQNQTLPLRITLAEMEAYRQFLIVLAGVVPANNPIYREAAAIINRLEDFADQATQPDDRR